MACAARRDCSGTRPLMAAGGVARPTQPGALSTRKVRCRSSQNSDTLVDRPSLRH